MLSTQTDERASKSGHLNVKCHSRTWSQHQVRFSTGIPSNHPDCSPPQDRGRYCPRPEGPVMVISRSDPLRSRSMDLCLEEACNFRWLSDTRVRNANLMLAPCTSANLSARMTALSEARSSIYTLSSGLRCSVNNAGACREGAF